MEYQFVDCRWSLDDPTLGRAEYLAGHIPGAVFLDVGRDLAGPAGAGGGRHPLPGRRRLRSSAAGAAGIGADTFVVAYGSLGGAERLWWLLRHFGHDACAVIDLEAWRGPLSSGEERAEPAEFVPRPRNDDTIELDELAGRLDELVVVDARLPARFLGEPNPVDRVPGRIPGALNVPWQAAGQSPKPPAGELVAYCGSGITACVVLHRLHLTGRDGRLYPGSWSEWEQHPELPVERGLGRRGRGDRAVAEPYAFRYRSQRFGIFGVASRMKSTGAGGRGGCLRTMCTSCGSRFPLRRLQGAQEVTTFSQTESPPRERGITWSSVRRPVLVPQ